MSFNVGLNVVEVDGRVAPSIQAAPTSVAAMIIRSPRGLPGQVYRVTNWSEFVEHFGAYQNGAFGAYAMRGFIDNGGAVAYVTRVVDDTVAVAATNAFDDGTNPVLTVTAGYRGQPDPGAWGNNLSIRIAPNTETTGTYDLFVRQTVAGKAVTVETWEKLNHSTAADAEGVNPEAAINDPFTGSKFIIVTEDDTANPVTTDDTSATPITEGWVPLAGGQEDSLSGATLENALMAALPRFDVHQVQLVVCPETDSAGFVTEALTYCIDRGDCMFVGHTPLGQDAAAAKGYSQPFRGEKVYGAMYFPWIQVNDPIGTRKWIPPTGHILGVYARTERQRGIWKAPAGNAAKLNGALDVQHHITDAVHTDLVKNGSLNAVRFIPGLGIVIDSSRTLSTSTIWLYVNIRLLFNFVKSSLMGGLRWVVQEPNDKDLWNKVKFNSVTPFLMGLWRRGAFGSGLPEETFTVKIDSENNPPASVQQGILNIEIYFYPVRPAETIVITVGQQESGASASEG